MTRNLNNKGLSPVWTILILVILIALGFLIYTTFIDTDTPTNLDAPDTPETSVDQETVNPVDDNDTLSQIVDNPEQFYGQGVTVRGEIQDLYSRRVLKLSDQTIGDELIVILPRALTDAQATEAEAFFEDNADASVTGTVRQLTVAQVEQEFGFDVPADIEIEFTETPVVVADSFKFTDSNTVIDFTQGTDATQE